MIPIDAHSVVLDLFEPAPDYFVQCAPMPDYKIAAGDWLAVHRTDTAKRGDLVLQSDGVVTLYAGQDIAGVVVGLVRDLKVKR